MTWEKTEGIVLQSTIFQSKHRILKVFTQKKGLISFFVKNVSHNNTRLVVLTSPLSHGEWVYQKSHKDLHKVKDSSLIDSFLNLRDRLESLDASGSILRAILQTQLPNKPAPALFALLVSYLKKIPEFESPDTLSLSFRLKLLTFDGILHVNNECSHCKRPPYAIIEGESVCQDHAQNTLLDFSSEEFESILQLTYGRKFSDLKKMVLSGSLKTKLQQTLSELLQQ